MEKLKKYKDKFLEKLEYQCILYKLIGNGTHESPMWLQMRNSYKKTTLLFENSQKDGLGFEIKLSRGDNFGRHVLLDEEFRITYNYFRDLKYTYIKENHPTIYKQIR